MSTENPTSTAPAVTIQETPPSAIVAELASTMPTPTAPETPVQTPPSSGPSMPVAESKAPLKDVNGTAFDPSRHAVDGKGQPRTDKLGRFFSNRLGGVRAKAQPSTPPQQASFIPEGPATPVAQAPTATVETDGSGKMDRGAIADKYALLADVYTRAALSGLMAALGDEWQPDDDAEFIGLRDSVAAYLRATNREDLSPGWALTFAVATYGGKRIPRPKTQTRIAFFMDKVRAWWRGRSVARVVNSFPHPEGNA